MAGHKWCRAVVLLVLFVGAWTGLSKVVSAQGGGPPAVSIRPLVLGWDDLGVTRVPPNGPATTPLWSHDGALLAFASEATNLASPGDPPHGVNPTPDVYVVDRMTGHHLWVSAPDTSVSPLASAYPLGFSPVADASGNRVLAFWSNARRLAGEPAGAPDDASTDIEGRYDLFLARIVPDGVGSPTLVGIERLTNHGAALFVTDTLMYRGSWSAGGTAIVFTSPDDSDGLELASYPDQDLFTLDVTTRAITRLTHAVGDATGPIWSPDGAWIAFTFSSDPTTDLIDQNRDGAHDLPPDTNLVADVYLLEMASGAVRRVTRAVTGEAATASEGAEALAFSPDGRHLLFSHMAANLPMPTADGVRQVAAYAIAPSIYSLVSGSATAQADAESTDAVYAPLGAPARAGSLVAFSSRANNLPGLVGTNVARHGQLVLRDGAGTFTLLSRNVFDTGAVHGAEGSRHAAIAPMSIDGRLAIAFDSDATDLVGAVVDPNPRIIFLATMTTSDGDLRLRAVSPVDGSNLDGRTLTSRVSTTLDVRLDVENEGAIPMNGVEASMTLPAGFALSAWDPPQATVAVVNNAVVWTIGPMAPAHTDALRMTLTAPGVAGSAAFAAEISTSDPDVDSTPANALPLEDDLARFTVNVERGPTAEDDTFRGTIGQSILIPFERLLANDTTGMAVLRFVGPTYGATWSVIDQRSVGNDAVLVGHTGTSAEIVTFQYEAEDPEGGLHVATVTVHVDNRAPASIDQFFLVVPGETLEVQWTDVVQVPGNADPDGDPITLGSHGLPDATPFGTLTFFGPSGPGGGFRFTPNATYAGGFELRYSVVDLVDFGGAARASWPQGTLRFDTAAQAADLSVEFDYGVSAEVGQTMHLQLRVNNAGPARASGTVRLRHTSNLEFAEAVAGFDPATGLWTLPQVNAGSFAFLRFPVRIIGEGDGSVTAEIVSATAPDPDPANNRMGVAANGVVREADVSVDVVFSPTSVLPGEPITVTAVVSNAGSSVASNVVLTGLDYLLATHVIDSVTPSQGSCAPLAPPQSMQCTLGAIGATLSATVTVVARPTLALFPDDILPEVSVGVRAQVSAAERDPLIANNETYRAFSVRRPRADVSVTLSATPASVLPGEQVTITATVTNAGPETATSVTLTDFEYIIATHTIDRVTPSQGTCTPPVAGPWLQCAIGTLASGASATVVLVARPTLSVFPDEVAPEVSVGVRAEVSAAEQDAVPGNNQAYRAFAVRRPRADVAVNISASPALVAVGEPVTITAVVSNAGPDAATAVALTGLDYVISTHTIVSVSPSQGSCAPAVSGQPLQCGLGTLAVGASATVVVVARPTGDVFGGNTAPQISVGTRVQVASDRQDPEPANNQAYRAFDVRRPDPPRPVAVNDAYSFVEDGPYLAFQVLPVMSNDSPATGTALTVTAAAVLGTAPAVATPMGDSVWFLINERDWSGTFQIEYTVADEANSSSAIATITVTPVNDPVVARDDLLPRQPAGGARTITRAELLANDDDVDGDAVVQLDAGSATGVTSIVQHADQSITLTFDAGDVPVFRYTLTDGLHSGTATVRLNRAPGAQDDPGFLVVRQQDHVFIPVPALLANDVDPDGDLLTVDGLESGYDGSHVVVTTGWASHEGVPYLLVTVTDPAYSGPAQFRYRASDGNALSNPVTVTITVTPRNAAPQSVNDAFTVRSGEVLTVAAPGLLANDTDADGDALQISRSMAAANGNVLVEPDGSFTYTPNPGFVGTDTFTYRATDGIRYWSAGGIFESTDATVTVTVTPRIVAPPRIVVRLLGATNGGRTVTLEVANTGGSTAASVAIDQVTPFRLLGRGSVTLQTPLPIAVGTLAPGQTRTITMQLAADPRVLAYLLVEAGRFVNEAGSTQRFGGLQIVTP